MAKGKKTVYFDMAKDPPADDEILALIMGRSGKLRAPAIRKGSTLVVGFNPDIYSEALG